MLLNQMFARFVFLTAFLATPLQASVLGGTSEHSFVQIAAQTKEQRSQIVNLGVSVEGIRSDSVWAVASPAVLKRIRAAGFTVLGEYDPAIALSRNLQPLDFPDADSRYHNYEELRAALDDLNKEHNDLVQISVIGKTAEARDILALRINTSQNKPQKADSKPGVIFIGNHHAREHLGTELSLMFAEYLLKNRKEPTIQTLLQNRDIWIIPMINPDGTEFDIETGKYQFWRKNRRANDDGSFGVDLNRNYSYHWGAGGSDTDPRSDIYMGPTAFSEPETSAVKHLIEAHPNLKILLSFHSYSELILYPWGYSYDPIANTRDREVFTKMAQTMAGWNGYRPQQSSELYITSGDTTDWAYGELGLFAFTFELSPSQQWYGGGFYPGPAMIDKVFEANLKPCLYLTDLADNPYRVLETRPTGWLKNYMEPRIPESAYWDIHPLPRDPK